MKFAGLLNSPRQFLPLAIPQIMRLVILATMPGVFIGTWFFGYGIILNILFAMLVGVACEALVARLRGFNIQATLADNSTLVTALLFALTVPPGTPWWLLSLGMIFAIALVKHAYGGLGHNPFNPAMAAYLFLLLAYPLDMTTWHIPASAQNVNLPGSPIGWQGLLESLGCLFPLLAGVGNVGTIDGLAMATPLIESKMATRSAIAMAIEEGVPLFARSSETGWELVNMAYLSGGLCLLFLRIISWQIPASILGSTLLLSALFYSTGTSAIVGTPYLHLFGGATLLGAFFIATDPVSAATGGRAKIAYGIIIGISLYSIRVWGSYPDAVAIAVLFGNFCAPLLDRLLAPRIYSHDGLCKKSPNNRISGSDSGNATTYSLKKDANTTVTHPDYTGTKLTTLTTRTTLTTEEDIESTVTP